MSQNRIRLTGALAALVAGACLIAAPAPAGAAAPAKNTTYKGDGGQPGTDVTIKVTLKVGSNPQRITRATVDVSCPDDHNRVVFENVPVTKRGSFAKYIYVPGSTTVPRFYLEGTFKTRHKATLSFQTAYSDEPCGNYVMEGSAHD